MHSINCLFDHGRRQEQQQQQQKIVGPLKHQLADSFPIFQLTPRWELALRSAALLKFVQAAKVFECIQAFTHSLSHTHSYSDTLARDVDLAFAAAAAALETQITITWNAFQSAAESVAYSSAPTARQLSPQPFLPVFFLLSHSTHAGLPAKSYWEMFLFKLCVIRMDKLSANQTEKRTKLPFCFALFVFCASIFEHFHRQQPDTHTLIHTCSHTYAHTNGNK